ncbi:NmrA family NAD(P)-binding protein [Streptomyces sp. DH41]|uniref:NmrA family NAD(P)-binding protein n=1 Tax=Streptomyces sp. DH41 TaxID=3040125 RepID=UPI0024418D43|nr:NmrA family NAD(P)-binding protein [Streptomyces sp. DH41]MDG9726681.1 NAD(P)H-binding protein [Streptomyces sp. DH41]
MTDMADMRAHGDMRGHGDMTVVVTGASGRTGRRVAEAARAAGLTVRAASRATGFDWRSPSTWADVLRGADAAYLAYPTDVGAPDAAEAVGALAREAAGCGVRRLVLLSARGEEQARPTEEALAGAGMDWTVVRAAWFAQNFSEGPLVEELRQRGELVFPAGDRAREPFVDLRDVADVVVAALTSGDRYAGRVLEVSGPRLLTFGEAVAEIARETGRPLTYRAVSPREYGENLAGFGVPEEEVAFLVELFGDLLDGRNARLSDGVRQVLGRAPRDFGDFVREGAAAGAWAAGASDRS